MRYYDPSTGRYLRSDPIGILRDYSDPQMRVSRNFGIPLESQVVNAQLNHLYGYVNQNPQSWIDPFGLDIHVSMNSSGAQGFGHVGGAANSSQTEGFYPTFPSTLAPGVVKPDTNIDGEVIIPATPAQDNKFHQCMMNRKNNPGLYAILTRNCTGLVRSCLYQAGITGFNNSADPKKLFCSLAKQYGCSGASCNQC